MPARISDGNLGSNGDDVLLELVGIDGGNGDLKVTSSLGSKEAGQETGNVRRGPGGARDGGDGILGGNPGGLDAQTVGKDLSALAVVDITRLGLGRDSCFTPSLPDLPSNCP